MASLLVKLVKASLLVSRSQVPDVSSGKKEATFSCSTQPCFLSLTRLIVVIFCAAKHKIAAKHACSVLQSTMHASKWTFFAMKSSWTSHLFIAGFPNIHVQQWVC